VDQKHARKAGFHPWLAAAAALLSLAFITSCLDSKPRVLGSKRPKFTFEDVGTSSFKFNFAYRPTTGVADLQKIFFVQGAANTETAMISTCNSAGTGCVCQFMVGSTVAHESSSTEISYDTTGNYFRCYYSDSHATAIGSITQIRVRNLRSTIFGETLSVQSSVSKNDILGADLNANKVRTVSRYSCLYNFLQKQGTTETLFDCSTQLTVCDTGDFCLLQSWFPYYLYAHAQSSNHSRQGTDELYNAASTGQICGLQIKRFDCTVPPALAPAGEGGTAVAKFGLYAESNGIFDTAVSLGVTPGGSAELFGYAAQTSSYTSPGGVAHTLCPPGLERFRLYQAEPDPVAVLPSHNYPTSLVATVKVTEARATGDVPADFVIYRKGGGDCNGTVCTPVPSTALANAADYDFVTSPSSPDEFCVFPVGIL
jgi:hypothetical protein